MSSVIQYVFVPALIAGLLLGIGAPGVEDLLYDIWKTTSETLDPMIPENFKWQFGLIGLLVLILVLLAKAEPFLYAIGYGLLATLSAICAFIGGFLLFKVPTVGIILIFVGLFLAMIAKPPTQYSASIY